MCARMAVERFRSIGSPFEQVAVPGDSHAPTRVPAIDPHPIDQDRCPDCGTEPLRTKPWWDDPPELGGACIGTTYYCSECDWEEDC